MKTIYKFPLAIDDVQVLSLPAFAQPLSVQMQGSPQLWALVDTEQPAADYIVHCYGTGHPVQDMPVGCEFLGTVQLSGGALVFHFFGFYASFVDAAREKLD